jgi:hypothetical protein
MSKVTQLHASPQRPRHLTHPVTVSQWLEIRSALRELPAQIATATADEFERRGYVPPSDLTPIPAPVWLDDETPF